MEFEIILAKGALADLDEIIDEAGERSADAEQLVMAILRDIKLLRDEPRRGGILRGQVDRDYRVLIHPPHRVVYKVSDRDRTVTVHRVWHSARGRPEF